MSISADRRAVTSPLPLIAPAAYVAGLIVTIRLVGGAQGAEWGAPVVVPVSEVPATVHYALYTERLPRLRSRAA